MANGQNTVLKKLLVPMWLKICLKAMFTCVYLVLRTHPIFAHLILSLEYVNKKILKVKTME